MFPKVPVRDRRCSCSISPPDLPLTPFPDSSPAYLPPTQLPPIHSPLSYSDLPIVCDVLQMKVSMKVSVKVKWAFVSESFDLPQ